MRARRLPRSTRASSMRARSAAVQGMSARAVLRSRTSMACSAGVRMPRAARASSGGDPKRSWRSSSALSRGHIRSRASASCGEEADLAGELGQVEDGLRRTVVVGARGLVRAGRVRCGRPAGAAPWPCPSRRRPDRRRRGSKSVGGRVGGPHGPGAGPAVSAAAGQGSAAGGPGGGSLIGPLVVVGQAPDDELLDEAAPGVVGPGAAPGGGDGGGRGLGGEAEDGGAVGQIDVVAQRSLAGADGLGHEVGHPGLTLQPGHGRVLLGPLLDAVDDAGDGGEGDAALAQGGQDVLDVAQEEGLGPITRTPWRSRGKRWV